MTTKTVERHFGPHNARALIAQCQSAASAFGEAAMGAMRHMHWAGVASGKGLGIATGDPQQALAQAEAMRRDAASRCQIALMQVQEALNSAFASIEGVNAVLATPPGATKPQSQASRLADAAGATEPGPKLALA